MIAEEQEQHKHPLKLKQQNKTHKILTIFGMLTSTTNNNF